MALNGHTDMSATRLFSFGERFGDIACTVDKRCANGLSVRFLRMMRWNSRRVAGSSTDNFLIDGYLPRLVMTPAATTAKKGPVAARLIRRLMAWV